MDVQTLRDHADNAGGPATDDKGGQAAGTRVQLQAEVDPEQNIYRKKRDESRYNKTPWSAYFYYVGKIEKDEQGKDIRHVTLYNYVSHHSRIKRVQLKGLVTSLALNARKPEAERNPSPVPIEIFWTRKSYIIFLVDDPHYEFEKDNAVQITKVDHDNYTFYDAKDFDDIELPASDGHVGTERVTAVCFINHMKSNDKGDDLIKGEKQKFIFAPRPGTPLRLWPDDGGTNMGPPVPPP